MRVVQLGWRLQNCKIERPGLPGHDPGRGHRDDFLPKQAMRLERGSEWRLGAMIVGMNSV